MSEDDWNGRPVMSPGERELRNLSNEMAHGFLVPLAVLRARLEAALASKLTARQYRRLLRDCLRELRALGVMVSDLLLMAQAETVRLPFQGRPLDLAAIAAGTVRFYRPLAEAKRLKLILRRRGALKVWGDQNQLKRLVVQLLDNAVKYTPGGGKVTVETLATGSSACLTVSDTGIGIGPAHLPRIFEPFYRVDKVAGRARAGVGLGLSIARSIAERHGGSLRAESTPGEGSRFFLLLPLYGEQVA